MNIQINKKKKRKNRCQHCYYSIFRTHSPVFSTSAGRKVKKPVNVTKRLRNFSARSKQKKTQIKSALEWTKNEACRDATARKTEKRKRRLIKNVPTRKIRKCTNSLDRNIEAAEKIRINKCRARAVALFSFFLFSI